MVPFEELHIYVTLFPLFLTVAWCYHFKYSNCAENPVFLEVHLEYLRKDFV